MKTGVVQRKDHDKKQSIPRDAAYSALVLGPKSILVYTPPVNDYMVYVLRSEAFRNVGEQRQTFSNRESILSIATVIFEVLTLTHFPLTSSKCGNNFCNRLSGVSVGLHLLLIFLLEGNTSMGLVVVL